MKNFIRSLSLKKVFLIGEISGNHLNNFELSKKIIMKAKSSGFDAIKLQTLTPQAMTVKSKDKIFYINDGLWKKKYLWDLYNESSMKQELQKKIFKFCKKINILCFSSPFDQKSVDFLEDLNCPVYKLASQEIFHFPLIKKIASTKKPLIISTGMAQLDEIKESYKFAKKNGIKNVSLLYCVSNYPSKFYDFNMNNIKILKETFDCPIGFSDHSTDNDVAKAAIMMGASIIEKHISIDSKRGTDSKFSLVAKDFSNFRKEVDKAYIIKGKNFFYRKKSELKNKRYRRSIFASKEIKCGEKFTEKNIQIIRPSNGLDPKYYYDLLKLRSTKKINKFKPIPKNIIKKIY